MQTKFKKTLLAALPVAGLLFTAPAVYAHDGDNQDRGSRHERYHDRRNDLHEEFHEHPYNDREHRRFHQYLKRDHRDYHGDRWSSRDRGWWDWRDRNRGWDWHRRNNDRDWSWGRSGWRYDDDNYRRSWW